MNKLVKGAAASSSVNDGQRYFVPYEEQPTLFKGDTETYADASCDRRQGAGKSGFLGGQWTRSNGAAPSNPC